MKFHGVDLVVVDTHADSLGGVLRGERHLFEDSHLGQLDFPRMRQMGHSLQCFSLWVEPEYKPERALTRLLAYVDAFWAEIGGHPEWIIPVLTVEDLDRVASGAVMGGLMSVEGAEAVGTDPALVRILYRLGVRLMSLTWNQRNMLADGAGEDPGGGGLSRAGREVIQEMNRVGIVVDVSHLSHAAFWDVLECSQARVIASHSNCWTLREHRRNLTDGQIRALAARGGVQGITFVRDFLGPDYNLSRVADHIVYSLDLIGDDRHTALGSDFDGVEEPVSGLEDVNGLVALADMLSARGLSDQTVVRIFGQNYLELFRDALSGGRS